MSGTYVFMKKEVYYFSHDANAQDDPKCMKLIDELGWDAYGIFWAICERMRSQCDFMLPHSIIPNLAKRWNFDEIKLKKIINDFDLFKIENDNFYSERLKRSMELKSEKARESANYRWNNTTAMRTDSDRNANGMRKDAIKVKKSKRKEKENTNFSDEKINTSDRQDDIPEGQFWGVQPD